MNLMHFKGLCLGASTLSMVTLEQTENGIKIVDTVSKPHEGNPRRALLDFLDGEQSARLCVTGRKFRRLLKIPNIPEPEAVELAYDYCRQSQEVDGIVSAGGETFIFYELDRQGLIANVHTGNKCASGTGEFFLQQIQRMGMQPEEALKAATGFDPYPVAGRCSVFCKSDCTHALNKGENKGRVIAGLCRMMASKILELVHKTDSRRIMLVGGTAQNQLMVENLKPELEVIVPPEAPYFEALGAALWGLHHQIKPIATTAENIFAPKRSSFSFLPPLQEAQKRVAFKDILQTKAQLGDRLLLGLDVGSTTTKAVLIREKDNALVASIYLRTSGDPVQAARNCYLELAPQVPPGVEIIGLGVTGSGRQIAGLHALTPAVINEIIAHATAAVYFDPEVDTIFEIGGQDAKYTYIINGVPSDYAMNEACSAGTGSFLEEAAEETLDVTTTGIGPLALKALEPPNFNDQCAAFISSDIKTAVQEGKSTNDILAGLVYSICLNYLTRVKGNRPVGRKVFMQGGVCYNQAVPIAMASLLDKEIVVPPEPGLMGAFGVALEVKDKIGRKLLKPEVYDLKELAEREIERGKTFTCSGDEGCDRRCSIRVLKIKGKNYPFGGSCSRYAGVQRQARQQAGCLDFVFRREHFVFKQENKSRAFRKKSIGLNRSLTVNTFYPLYYHFFTSLGFEVITPHESEQSGRMIQGASFCFPVELAHGYMASLIKEKPDYFFLPQVKGLPINVEDELAVTCPLVQGEPYYLQASFDKLQNNERVLTPVLDFADGYQALEEEFVRLGVVLGASRREAREAYRFSVSQQEKVSAELKLWGEEILKQLETDPQKKAIILFGRPYNAFSAKANMGIPHKFASRGWLVLPCDLLPYEKEACHDKMYWANGQIILRAARLVCRHPRLFGVHITNFSCGPDSFIISYFREIMGDKPSLTLELDNHTADAGLDTRVEAFLDIVDAYLETGRKTTAAAQGSLEKAARPQAVVENKSVYIQLPGGEKLTLDSPQIKLLIPTMGEEGNRFISAALSYKGIKSEALPHPGHKELNLGLAHSNCKECLPLQLTTGSLLRYLEENGTKPGEQIIYFMPEASGPCRFGQYQVFMNMLLDKLQITNVTTLSLTADNSYGGLGIDLAMRIWLAIIIADIFSEIYSALLVLGRNQEEALGAYEKACSQVASILSAGTYRQIKQGLAQVARQLSEIELTGTLGEIPQVALLGEIYVRNDRLSRQGLVEKLAQQGIFTKIAPINEWVYYIDYLLARGLLKNSTFLDRWKNKLQTPFKVKIERDMKKILASSGLYQYHLTDVKTLLDGGKTPIPTALTGEAILTVSFAIKELIDEVSGIIAIGPFGCMPNRLAEAVASKTVSRLKPDLTSNRKLTGKVLSRNLHLPFMAIETDGSVFPQVVEARLESFILQAKRLHKIIEGAKQKRHLGISSQY
jgi:predicted CoA-substrate-specific enzyme activase